MALSHFIMLICELLNNDPDIVPEEAPFIVLDSKYALCMAKNGKENKHTRHIESRMHSVRNGENSRCKRLFGVREVCNWQTLLPRILVSLI